MSTTSSLLTLAWGGILCLALTSCGGGPTTSDPGTGDGGGGNEQGGGNEDGNGAGDSGSESINSGIEGKFFFEDADSAYLMDISSGEYTLIPNTDWEEQDTKFPLGIALYSAKAFKGENTFLLTVNQCKSRPGNVLQEDTCIVTQNFDGSYQGDVTIENEVIGRAKPSINGQFFAVFRDLDEEWLSMYQMNGDFVSNVQVAATRFEWLPDGRLIYSSDERTIVVTEPYSTSGAYGWTLPTTIPAGKIDRMSASPDGSHLAFTVQTDGTLVSEYALLFIVEVETGSLRKLATVPAGEEEMFHESAWSPDGAYLAVLEGGVTGNGSPGAINPGVAANMYLIPTNATEPLVVSKDENLRSPGVILLQRYLHLDRAPADNTLTDGFPDWQFDWIAE